jgi:hypothetical protein
MINRSVIGKKAKDAVPIDREQISTLKQKALRVEEIEGRGRVSVWDFVTELWTELVHWMKPKHNKCNIYGHTLPHTGWTVGRLPHCGDCGAPIEHPDDLRKALPRDSYYN